MLTHCELFPRCLIFLPFRALGASSVLGERTCVARPPQSSPQTASSASSPRASSGLGLAPAGHLPCPRRARMARLTCSGGPRAQTSQRSELGSESWKSVQKFNVLFCIFVPPPSGEYRPRGDVTSPLESLSYTLYFWDCLLPERPAVSLRPLGLPAPGLCLLSHLLRDGILTPLKQTLDLVFVGGQTLELSWWVSHHRAATSRLCPQARRCLSWDQFCISVLTAVAPASWHIPFLDPCLGTEQGGTQRALGHDCLQSPGTVCSTQSKAGLQEEMNSSSLIIMGPTIEK